MFTYLVYPAIAKPHSEVPMLVTSIVFSLLQIKSWSKASL